MSLAPLEKQETTSTLCIDPTFKVTLADSDDPQRLSTMSKWVIVGIISSGTLCVTCASSMVRVSLVDIHCTNVLARRRLLKLPHRKSFMSEAKLAFLPSACSSPVLVRVRYSLAPCPSCMAGISSIEYRSACSLHYRGQWHSPPILVRCLGHIAHAMDVTTRPFQLFS